MYLSYICVQLLCSGNNDAAVEVVFDQIETISMIGGESSSGMNEDEDDEEEEEEDEENQGVTTTVVVSEGLQMISKVMKEGKDGDGGGGERWDGGGGGKVCINKMIYNLSQLWKTDSQK